MAGPIRADKRLRPSLLDRLTDDEPMNEKPEPRADRVIDAKRMRQIVMRDLAFLFNASRLERGNDMAKAPYARRSVVNFGLPALSGQTASTLETQDVERELKQAILDYEPRLLPDSLEVSALMEISDLDHHNVIGIQIRGLLWGDPVPTDFLIRTEIDLEAHRVLLTDLTAGAG
jgi:type VI secretion system protein ImpF